MKILKSIQQNKYADILIIGLGLFLAYGLLIPFLHYYIDDWYWAWTWNTYGHAGITQYFSTNRPIWGLLFHITLPVLSIHPLVAQLFSLFMRVTVTILFLVLLKQLWPENRKENVFAALIFGLYPGFALQSIAITYSHIFLILSVFILSLICTIQWVNTNKKRFLFISIILSFVNLITMEYFFSLELIRFVIIWIMLSRQTTGLLNILKRTTLRYIPYLFILIITVVIRTTLLTQIQTNRYSISLFSDIKSQPLHAIYHLISRIAIDFYITTIAAWQPAIDKLAELNSFTRTNLLIIAICIFFSILTIAYLRFINNPEKVTNTTQNYEMLSLGLMGFLFAGWPFWFTNLELTPYYLLSRYTLPFLLGVSIIYGFIYTLLSKFKPISSLMIAFSLFTGMFYQIIIMNDFRIETMQNMEMMWQIHWRIPDLDEDTLVLITDYPNEYYDVASLATELSVMYPKETYIIKLPYFMLYSRNVDHSNEGGLQPDIFIKKNNVTANFTGSTSQMIAIDYDPAKCVRILDPDLDGHDTHLHEHVQKAALLTDLSLIDTTIQSDPTAMYYFGKEPIDSWCYYFENADLAKQKQDWEEVISLYEEASEQGFGFKSERERYAFIEAYAQLGQWEQAYALIENCDQNELSLGVCKLANRIDKTTVDSDEKSQFLQDINNLMSCH